MNLTYNRLGGWGGGGGGWRGDSYIRSDRSAVSESMLMDQTTRENMSKTDQRFRVNVLNVTNMTW